jgi:hypothetical protein
VEQISRFEYSDLIRNKDALRLKALAEIIELVRKNIERRKKVSARI